MLTKHGKAFSFAPKEIGCVDPTIVSPMVIFMVPHVPWDLKPFPISKALLPKLIELLKEKIEMGILEPSIGPYSNQWFTVPKKLGALRFIQDMQSANKMTISSMGSGPMVDEFAEAFVGRAIYSMDDLYSGATNSAAHMQNVMNKVLRDFIPEKTMPFLDDIPIKGCAVEEKDESLDDQGHLCGTFGKRPSPMKVDVIQCIQDCTSVTEVRRFLGACVFYRIWIPHYAHITEPMYELLRKGKKFKWSIHQGEAMARLKQALVSSPTLRKIDYQCERHVIVMVDTSPIAIGWAVGQDDIDGCRFATRFGARVLSPRQHDYPQVKRELWGVVIALKTERNYLIGADVVLETDCLPLLGMIANYSIPDIAILRWIAYIKTLNPELRHIAGKDNPVADMLSRARYTDEDDLVVKDDDQGSWVLSIGITSSKKEGEDSQLFREEYYTGKLRDIGRVVDDQVTKEKILQEFHDTLWVGHRGIWATYMKIKERYWWKGLYQDVAGFVGSCMECQMQSKLKLTTRYNPEGNGKSERGHPSIVQALVKACKGKPNRWPQLLPFALWANRTTHSTVTRYMPKELMLGQKSIMPMEDEIRTWAAIAWEDGILREELPEFQIRQLERRPEDVEIALRRLQAARVRNKERFDKIHRLRPKPIHEGDWVLVYYNSLENQHSIEKKFVRCWFGPYVVVTVHENATYSLRELDGTPLKLPIVGKRVKYFKRHTTNGRHRQTHKGGIAKLITIE
ncbi:hypothetical protein R1flu_003039 [Riccia fluitans]|uniref:Uncharacterized protein n=1 Tax=Riccia fluitans TaxID=41844 RepID=A0ABD1YBL4_9MARC